MLASLLLLSCVLLMGPSDRNSDHTAASEETAGASSTLAAAPWWEIETAPTGGAASLNERDWYKQVMLATPGTLVKVDRDGDGDTDVVAVRDGKVVTAVVDDNDNMRGARPMGDRVDDCWLYDLNSDGLLDRMVDYIDEDADGAAETMEVRYYAEGELRWGWFWEDIDEDQLMWTLDVEMLPIAKVSDMHGDNLFFANKLDATSHEWVPIGECPFAFYDNDHDGFSDECVRVCVCADANDCSQDIDYCNNLAFYWEENSLPLAYPCVTNVRHSLSLFPARRKAAYAYDCGLTMIGVVSHAAVAEESYSQNRRPPRATVRIPWGHVREVANSFSASATGFSWDEAGGHVGWEGVFWTWERRPLHDTGGWTAKYNVRREYDGQPSDERLLYYSPVDNWIHLLGAEEGWLEIEDPVTRGKKLAELRYFDENGDGIFDTWEYDLDADGQVDRRAHVEAGVNDLRTIPWNPADVAAAYEDLVMDGARRIAQILGQLRTAAGLISLEDSRVADIEAVLSAWHGDDRARRLYERYLCELYYVRVGERLRVGLQRWIEPICAATDKYDENCIRESERRWLAQCLLTRFETSYEEGDLEQAGQSLAQVVELLMAR